MQEYLGFILIYWLCVSAFVGGIANACGSRNFLVWTFLAILVSPLMAILALGVLEVRALRPAEQRATMQPAEQRVAVGHPKVYEVKT